MMGSRQFTTIVKLMQFYQKEHLHVKAGGRVRTPPTFRSNYFPFTEIIKKLCDGSYCEVHEGKLKKRLKNGKDKIVNVAQTGRIEIGTVICCVLQYYGMIQ